AYILFQRGVVAYPVGQLCRGYVSRFRAVLYAQGHGVGACVRLEELVEGDHAVYVGMVVAGRGKGDNQMVGRGLSGEHRVLDGGPCLWRSLGGGLRDRVVL